MNQEIDGNLLDIYSGKIIKHQVLMISQGIIAGIKPSNQNTSQFICPGLIDCHVHLVLEPEPQKPAFSPHESFQFRRERVIANARQALLAGITTVRDCGYPSKDIFSIRDSINQNPSVGASIVSCGPCITQINGHGRDLGVECQGVENLKELVKQIIKNGADFIKVINNDQPRGYSLAELTAVVQTAHKLGKKSSCHVYQPDAFKRAVDAGFDTIEHCTVIPQDVISKIISQKTFIVPTVEGARDAIRFPEANSIGSEDIGEESSIDWQAWVASVELGVKALIKSGVKIVCGTDCGFMHTDFSTAIREILSYIELGMTPLAALQSATIVAAQALGQDNKIGSLDIGKSADIVVYQDNPLSNTQTLWKPLKVYHQGILIS